jgi:hypothetical protein
LGSKGGKTWSVAAAAYPTDGQRNQPVIAMAITNLHKGL